MKLVKVFGTLVIMGLASATVVQAKPPSGVRATPDAVKANDPILSPEARDAIGVRLGKSAELSKALEGKELTSRNISDALTKIYFPDGIKEGNVDMVGRIHDEVTKAFSNPDAYIQEASTKSFVDSVAKASVGMACQTRAEFSAVTKNARSGEVLEALKGTQVSDITKADLMGFTRDADSAVQDGAIALAGELKTLDAQLTDASNQFGKGDCTGPACRADLNGDKKIDSEERGLYLESGVVARIEDAMLGTLDEAGRFCDAACAKKAAEEFKSNKCVRIAA